MNRCHRPRASIFQSLSRAPIPSALRSQKPMVLHGASSRQLCAAISTPARPILRHYHAAYAAQDRYRLFLMRGLLLAAATPRKPSSDDGYETMREYLILMAHTTSPEIQEPIEDLVALTNTISHSQRRRILILKDVKISWRYHFRVRSNRDVILESSRDRAMRRDIFIADSGDNRI